MFSAIVFLLVQCWTHGNPTLENPGTGSEPETGRSGLVTTPLDAMMNTGVLNPSHYPARRACCVARHYLNTRYGSPFKWVGLDKVLKASAEDTADGRRYHVEFTVTDYVSNTSAGLCSAQLLFPKGEQATPQVNATFDELKINTKSEEEEAFYQRLKANPSLVSGPELPDSFGHMDPDMKPFWHLGGVASSFIMLKESNESTLYNMAQVANFTQLETQDDQLRFRYNVLLHEMVSQEIIRWKLLVFWSPAGGVKVLETEFLPKCQHCVKPPANTATPSI